MSQSLIITEIYASVQGESSYTGLPCTFIRLTGCPLRCRWCDTVYGFEGGQSLSFEQILDKIKEIDVPLVELTGGEPLAQAGASDFLQLLIDEGFEVMIETAGSQPIKNLPVKTHVVMDIKCPDSGMSDRNLLANLDDIKPTDEIKFVIASKGDFDWTKAFIKDYDLESKAKLLVSPAWGLVKPDQLVEWLLESKLKARLNLQTHKYIWNPKKKGV